MGWDLLSRDTPEYDCDKTDELDFFSGQGLCFTVENIRVKWQSFVDGKLSEWMWHCKKVTESLALCSLPTVLANHIPSDKLFSNTAIIAYLPTTPFFPGVTPIFRLFRPKKSYLISQVYEMSAIYTIGFKVNHVGETYIVFMCDCLIQQVIYSPSEFMQ